MKLLKRFLLIIGLCFASNIGFAIYFGNASKSGVATMVGVGAYLLIYVVRSFREDGII